MRPAVFIDRDGVINENRSDYVKTIEELVFIPGALEALARLAASDFLIVVITNQSAVGRGLISERQLAEINQHLIGEVQRRDGRIDGVYYCPHHPAENCVCRKPEPGLLLAAASELAVDLPSSFFIGDTLSDVQAALNAGCRPFIVRTGLAKEHIARMPPELRDRSTIAEDLLDAVEIILQEHEPVVSEKR